MSTIELTTTFQTMTCPVSGCGILYALPDWFITTRRRDHELWYCPNGHSLSYRGESDVERERRLRKAAERRRDDWHAQANRDRARRETEERRARAYKGHLTRAKKRAARGECECCGKVFPDLQAHMAEQHPDYVAVNDG